LTLSFGTPSHDAFNRIFAALDPEEMKKASQTGFVAGVEDRSPQQLVAALPRFGFP
jgi:hypothetical protein